MNRFNRLAYRWMYLAFGITAIGLLLFEEPGIDPVAAQSAPPGKSVGGKTVDGKKGNASPKAHAHQHRRSHLTRKPDVGNPNWMATTQLQNTTGSPIASFTTTWVVPSEPANKTLGQIVYLFNGLEPADGSTILQPVLQWGGNSLNGVAATDGWVVASWYVGPGNTAFTVTRPVKVNPGDTLVGVMNLLGTPTAGNPTFTYECFFSKVVGGAPVVINETRLMVPGQGAFGTPVKSVPELVFAYETLEAYASDGGVLTVCDAYPNQPKTTMSNIAIKTKAGAAAVLNWLPLPNSKATCGQHAVPSADGRTVDLWYRAESKAKAKLKASLFDDSSLVPIGSLGRGLDGAEVLPALELQAGPSCPCAGAKIGRTAE